MIEKDLISIIVPIYNVEQYLKKCLDSVINQTYHNIEIILIDDGSTDNCGSICDEYANRDKRIKVIHKTNGGLSDARNVGIDITKGKYITFIDSDDYVEKDYVYYLYNVMKECNTDIAFCGYKVCYEKKKNNGKKEKNQIRKCTKIEAFKEILYAKDFEVSAWAKMYLTEHFKDVRYPKGKIFEDNATTYKLIDKNEYVGLGYQKKYNYMVRNNSITKKEFTDKHLYLIQASDDMCEYISKYAELEKAILRKKCVARISTLNRMLNSSNRDNEQENKLRKEILSYKKILFDVEASNRDKISIIILIFGIKIYKKVWNFYEKMTGRK